MILNIFNRYLGKVVKEENKLLKLLYKNPKTLSEIAKELNESPQKVYYHLKKLLEKRVVEKIGNKYVFNYEFLIIPIIDIKLKEIKGDEFYKIMKDFTKENLLDAYIVLGNTYPHGPYNVIAKDNHLAAILTYKIGKYFEYNVFDYVKFDTDIIKEKLIDKNLILIGGPISNSITYRINNYLDVRFNKHNSLFIYSEYTKKTYNDDFIGLIAKIDNPFNKENKILVLAGVRRVGTFSAIFALVNNYIRDRDEFYYVVEGVDKDGDGYIDDVIIHEESP